MTTTAHGGPCPPPPSAAGRGAAEQVGRHRGRLRVAHLLVHGEVDGIGLHVLDLARAQMEEGAVDPVVLTTPSGEYLRRLQAAGVPLRPGRGTRTGTALADYGALDPGTLDIDLIHLHGYRAHHLLPPLGRLRPATWGLPVVATCHGFGAGTLRRNTRTWFELRSYRWLRLLITTSVEQARRAAAVEPGLPIAYVPNGVRVRAAAGAGPSRAVRQRFGFPPDAEVVAVIGRLAPEKRLDLFLRACRLVSRARPRARFLVVGDGRERQRVEREVRRLGLAAHVRLTGLIGDVPAVCAGITLLMHCADREGTPRAVLHAMAAGVPVVATQVGGLGEMITDGVDGALVQRGDAVALASRAVALLADPVGRADLGRRARDRVRSEFTVATMRRRVEASYDAVLTGPR